MPADPRQRNARHLMAPQGPQVLDFAGPKQEEGFRYGPAPLCLSGAYNSAKTVTLCLKMLFIADTYPGFRWFVGRKVWDELRKTTMSSFFKFCPRQAWEPHGRRSDTEKILELNNGSSFIWGHLDDPDTLTLVRGLEINGFMLDQAEELWEEIFTALLPRLGRWDKAQVPEAVRLQYETSTGQPWPWVHEVTGQAMPPTYALLTCNPDHELLWIYERFHPDSPKFEEKLIAVEKEPRLLADGSYAQPGERISYKDLGYKMIELSAYDNKYATRQSLQEMESQDETWKRRFLHGKWGIPEGQIHNVRPESVLEPDAAVLAHIQQRCTLHRALDHGDSAPTCCLWFAVDGDGNVFFYREYYMPNRLISEHRQAIHGLSHYERYALQLADPSIFGPSMQKHNQRWSVAEEYADCVNFPRENAIFWDKGDNDEFGTRNRISEYLKPSGIWQMQGDSAVEVPRIHPITKEKGLWPRLFFVKKTQDYPNGCDQAIRQIKSARRLKLGTDNGKPIFSDERDPGVPDHAYDCLHGDTPVYTFKGSFPIRDLVGTEGLVLSPAGWVKYRHCEKYRSNSKMITVIFEDGRDITCTSDHLFLTDSGWCRADSLLNKTVCDTVSQWNLSPLPTKFKNSADCGTTSADSISSAMGSGYIGPSGSTTTDQSLKGSTYTTSMKTAPITGAAISNCVPRSITLAIIPKASHTRRLSAQCRRLLRSGMEAMRAVSGIARTSTDHWGRCISEMCIKSAPYVGGLSLLHAPSHPLLDSAQTPVNPHGGASRARTTWSGNVFGVARNSNATSTPAASTVRVVAVVSAGSADSYCLTVSHQSQAFAVANGITVHNCARYAMASQPPLPNSIPKKYGERTFLGMRAMAIAARKRGKMANMAKEAARQYQRLYG